MQIRVDGWAWLNVGRWAPDDIEKLKSELSILPRRDVRDKRPPKPVYCYRAEGDLLGIPRMHPLVHKFAKWGGIQSDTSAGLPINLKFNGEFRDDQETALNTFVGEFRDRDYWGGILKAPGGYGKTAWATQLIATMGCTTLVLVNREFLMRQWRDEILSGHKDGSPFLPGAKVGFIQQDRCEFEGYDIAIALVHSVASATREYPPELYRWAGLLISDEVHSFGAPTWAPIAPKFSARYRVGLSATPRRKDGCADVFKWHIGDIIYQTDVSRMKGKVRRLFTNWRPSSRPGQGVNDLPDYALLRMMINSQARNQVIIDELVKIIESGRNVFVFSSRRKHLEILNTMLIAVKPDVVADFYVGRRSDAELSKAKCAQVIFCTFQMASQALNVPKQDTGILATPMGDIEQVWYRITRWVDGKKMPIMVDLIDDPSVTYFDNLWGARKRVYRRMGAI